MTDKPHVLVVDDDDGVRYTLQGVLEDEGFAVTGADSGEAALKLVHTLVFDLVFTDLRMPAMDGMTLIAHIQSLARPPKVVMITAHGSEKHAVSAMKIGAFDYLKKPFEIEEVTAVARRAVHGARIEAENERLKSELSLSKSLLFASPAMGHLAVLIGRVAPKNVNVLITGESGTGKERVAEAIVSASPRSDKPFLKFNCAGLTSELASSELFGHARGAFTGAVRARPGLFREADGGTLLLDEVGELDLTVQAKLLRALQDGEILPVGEDKSVQVNVRILAATHRDLSALVKEGRFRDDLRYRLTVVSLHIPPLRDRKADIRVLAKHFMDRAAERFGMGQVRLTEALLDKLETYPWPGNVRELSNVMESMAALSHGSVLDVETFHPPKGETANSVEPAVESDAPLKERVDAYERGLLAAALKTCQGNKSLAARRLGVSRATLHEKLVKYGLG
ncbi:MAG: sigma-54-dependent Fis family transcriptional regulator [Polyangiaceae bacterium]|nr:sigma-54-dependent Fis family transcriptional regulator [Polyangiaceae bacterium]